jgi:hypothetical protein
MLMRASTVLVAHQRLDEHVAEHRARGRPEERGRGSAQRGGDGQGHEGLAARQQQHARRHEGGGRDHRGGGRHQSSRQPVREGPAHEHEHDVRDGAGGDDEAELRRVGAEVDGREDDGEGGEAAHHPRQEASDPQGPERRHAQQRPPHAASLRSADGRP